VNDRFVRHAVWQAEPEIASRLSTACSIVAARKKASHGIIRAAQILRYVTAVLA
jgi:hypothetical protein